MRPPISFEVLRVRACGTSPGGSPGESERLCDSQRCLKLSSLEESLLGNRCDAYVCAAGHPARRSNAFESVTQ